MPGITTAASVGPGIDFTCVGLSTGNIQCIGANGSGELGNASAPGQSNTLVVVDGINDAIYVQAGYRYACALKRSGTVSCWGSNSHKQLGPAAESLAFSRAPVHVPGSEGSIGLSVGSTHACVVKADRSVHCWGNNDGGQLGAPGSSGLTIATPVKVPNVSNAVMVAAAVNMTCAMDDAGAVRCWGCDNGGGSCFSAPNPVAGLSRTRGIAAGAYHACAVRDDSRVVCWGYNSQGQLGAAGPERSSTPLVVPNIRDAVAVSTGAETSCALRASGGVSCWGENHIGQLGTLDAGPRSAMPVDVPGL
ncbi:RCC1 domain-containing protein [Pendulispora albinea]|uniref:RCC1 repeat-containing protein n=1 Tax=Pendulispora albinea TaxID=2741071 RepID=A0ABZ2LYK6_9BACT